MKDFLKKLKKVFGAETDEEPEVAGETKVTPTPPIEPKPVKVKPVVESSLPLAPKKREEIIRFIIHSLRPYVNEKNTGIKGLRLYLHCESTEEETVSNIAVYADRPGAFKNEELQRKFSDNYISPDPNWYFEFSIVRDTLPDCMFKQDTLGLDIIKSGQLAGHFTTAQIIVLSGQTEMDEYVLDPSKKQKYQIGRGRNPSLSTGAMHTNDIAFLSKEEPGYDAVKGAANVSVSRYHAMISFHPQQKKYFLTADKGGTPDSGNKTKLFTSNGKIIRLDIPGASHELNNGDQIELGGSARLLFKEIQ